jgi:subtilisin
VTIISQQLKATGVAEVIVVLDERTSLAAASSRDVVRAIGPHFTNSEMTQSSQIVEDGFVAASVEPRAKAARSRAAAAAATRAATTPETAPTVRYYPNLGVALGAADRSGVAALRADSRVRAVAGAPRLRLIRPTKRQATSLTRKVAWGIDALGVPELWDEGLSGDGVSVAHLDTGVDGRHPALKMAITAFLETDRLGLPVEDSTTPFDTEDHGTHTAGTIAGRPDRSKRSIGVAPGASLVSAIVIEGGHTVARVLAGMDWAIGNGVRVLSVSLGFPGYVDDFLGVTRRLREKGVLPVMAVGNEGPGATRSPGNYVEALSVGWANRDDTVDPDSSSGRFRRRRQPTVPDLVAPGGDIVSAKPGGGHQLMSGTSMATPHVAGLAALLFEAKPDATVAQVERAIIGSCRKLPGVPDGRQGKGMPNAPDALRRLRAR